MRKHSNKLIAAVAGTAAAVALSGVAYAYWTTTGAGSGSATATSDITGDKIEITQTSTNTGFYPGQTAQTVTVKVHNPASYSQKVGNITVSVADSVGSNAGTCAASNWAVVDIPASTENIPTLGKDNATSGGDDEASGIAVATLQLLDLSTNQDNCKGAVPVLTFSSASGA